jgi:predicted Zn-dependent protease
MPPASRFLTVVLLGLFAVALLAAEQPKTPPTKQQIAQWIKDLGDDDFDKREEASKKLWNAGPAAEAALVEAAKSKDEEVRRRTREILDKFKYGIYPDTPKNVVDLLNAYRAADASARFAITRQLFESGTYGSRALIKLVNDAKDDQARRSLLAVISADMNRAAPALIMEGSYDLLEMLLDLSMVENDLKNSAVNYSAFYLLRGQLNAAIQKVKNQKGFDEKRRQEMLAYLYRAKGDLKAAVAAADKAEQPELAENLLYEAGDWKELSKRLTLNVASKDIERLGYSAAYHRLAGNQKEFDATIAAILKYAADAPASDKATNAFHAAKALFLNEKPEEALKVLKDGGRTDMAFEILCIQLRFREAFHLAEQVRKSGGTMAPWLEILEARTRYLLGETDKAKEMFAKLAGAVKEDKALSWFENLVEAEVRAGLRDDAFEHTALILDSSKDMGWPSRLLPKLFPGRGDTAEVWFQLLRAAAPNVAASEQLKKIRSLMEGKTPEKEVQQLLTDGEAVARTKNAAELDRWILALVDTAIQYKQEPPSLALLEKTKTAATLHRLGDLNAEKKQWGKAAEQYKAVWEMDKHQPLALYLYGQALAKSGKETEGKKLMEQAHWLPLGDETVRHTFATALLQRGQTEAGRRENDLLLRTTQLASYYAGEAQRRAAVDALAKKDYLNAAEGHEKALLRCLKSQISFLQTGAYVGVPAYVHRLRARGLLEAGRFDEAKREMAAAQALLPGDVELAILLVPALEKRGQAKEAKELFDKSLNVYEQLCKDYPKCAMAYNSAAWLSVCCGRNLEAAKEQALKAVALAPTNAGHLDTLAEIYFQLGDKDKAIATQKKVVELEPKRVYFRKQLQRIEAGDPKAERPPENDD